MQDIAPRPMPYLLEAFVIFCEKEGMEWQVTDTEIDGAFCRL
jgi:hypothetical protein